MKRFMFCFAVMLAFLSVSFVWRSEELPGYVKLLTGVGVFRADADVAIDEAHFPDEVFRDIVSFNFDTNYDGVLDEEEIRQVTGIYAWYFGIFDQISSLEGIKYFTSLEELSCSALYEASNIISIDVSGMTSLKYLSSSSWEYGGKLAFLNVSGCTALEELYCGNNQIVSLDLSGCPALKELYCGGNQIVSLDLSGCPALKSISFNWNKIAVLDVSNHTQLEELDCSIWRWEENEEEVSYLTSINADGCTALEMLSCYGNRSITSVSVKGCTSLQSLNCTDNKISSLNLSGLSALTYLECYDNEISSLDLSGCTSLQEIDCCRNKITSLDVSELTSLQSLSCYENNISSLNVKGCNNMFSLYCEQNRLSALDLTGCYSLYSLSCFSNDIDTIDLSDCTWDLYDSMLNDEEYAGIELIREAKSAPVILTESIDYAFTGDYYYSTFIASGGAVEWSVSGKLPPKTSLTKGGWLESEQELKKAGKYTFTVKASNAFGTAEKTFTLYVFVPIEITTYDLKEGTIGKSYSMTIKAKGSKPLTWSASGLPKGLSINPKTGKISGKPEECGDFYEILITVSNQAETIETEYSLMINGIAPKISGSLAKPELYKPYSSKLKLTKGTEPVYWEIEDGWLPDGLSINEETGEISGVPEWGGTYKFKVTAYNEWGSASKKVTMTVKGKAPKITTKKLPDATAGTPYTFSLTATGDDPIYWEADELPAGLVLSGDGTISGTPEEATKKFSFTVWATNPIKTVKKKLSIKINAQASAKDTPSAKTDTMSDNLYSYNHDGILSPVTGLTENSARTENHTGNISGGYIIVAELGEISCDVAGMYDFEVELPDYVLEGSELIYIPKSDNPSDDDEIAEFFDDAGEEITAVPENRKISVSVWLNPSTIYNPAIAVKR